MGSEDDWYWRMPQKGFPRYKIDAKLDAALENCIDYDEDPVLGFPGTAPSEVALETLNVFALRQPNNIGYHTKSIPSEMGFLGTQKLEESFIYAVADMVGVVNPEREIDGYICNGGTEGNYHGLWLARNNLWAERRIKWGENRGIVVLHSFLFHYSLGKVFGRLLGGDPDEPQENRRGIISELPTDDRGELTPETVEEYVRWYYQEGYRRFAVFLTAGTVNLGSIDPVGAINDALERLVAELGIAVAIHVDAAFGGFVIPFVEPHRRFAFQHSLVTSLSLDAHKTGGVPYSAGVFLCRKGFLEYTKTDAAYIFCHEDHTVPGSRSGAMAAACWATVMHHGREGYARIAAQGMKMRDYLAERFQEIPGTMVFPSRLNILAVHLPAPLDERVRQRYCIVPDTFPEPLSSRARNASGLIERAQGIYRFTVMPHVTEEKIDRFFREWKR